VLENEWILQLRAKALRAEWQQPRVGHFKNITEFVHHERTRLMRVVNFIEKERHHQKLVSSVGNLSLS